VAILVGSQDHQTQIWKGVIQGPFHQSLVQIGPVASEFGVISSRLKRFLEKLIDLDQTGFISGRYIGVNIYSGFFCEICSFSRFIPIMQIRHILIKDHI
jgi:hypothetical protein